MRALCALPPRAQRLLAGRPPELDGQRLASDIQMLLRLAALAGEESVTAGAGPEQARALNRRGAAAVSGRPVPMTREERLEIPGPAGTIPARLYVPSGAASTSMPLLVYYHGGGWVIGDLDTHDSVCRFLATAAGVLVLSIDYRLAPEHPFPAAAEDADAAFGWAAANAAELGADPARIAVGGDSAGGNLAAVVEPARPRRRRAEAGDAAPVLPGHRRRRRAALASALRRWVPADQSGHGLVRSPLPAHRSRRRRPARLGAPVRDLSGLPPAYIATAGFDPLRDEGEAYAERMRAAGVPVALRRHRGLVHGFANLTAVSRSSRAAMFEAAGALRMGLG